MVLAYLHLHPGNNKIRSFFYKLFISTYYKHVSSVIIAANSTLLSVPVSLALW